MLDVEQAYSRPEAARMAKVLDDYAWRWFEAPLPDTDIEGYVGLRQRCLTAILNSGNRVLDARAVVAALQVGAWDSVRFDTTIAGGITAARSLASVADVFDLPVDLQSWGHTLIEAANLHAALGYTRSEYFEIAVPRDAYELGVETPIRIDKDSHVRAHDEPGLGVRLDWDQIVDAAVVYRDIR
jgi:L-alanine-DL-glutamate epimerase-like enolase superfamily enzyme